MSNLGLERYLEKQGLKLARAAVGDRYVFEMMRDQNFNLGGEQSGHMILSDYATTGDGLIAALQVLAVLVQSKRRASEICGVFEPMPQLLRNVRFNGGAPLEAPKVKDAIRAAETQLGHPRPRPGAQIRHRAADPGDGRGRRPGADRPDSRRHHPRNPARRLKAAGRGPKRPETACFLSVPPAPGNGGGFRFP